jgi:hypothetical protein
VTDHSIAPDPLARLARLGDPLQRHVDRLVDSAAERVDLDTVATGLRISGALYAASTPEQEAERT